MSIALLLHHYADYDLWANTRSVERLQRESDAFLDRHVASSFPSLRATVLHIRDAEAIWAARLQGTSGRWPAEADQAIGTLLKYSDQLHDLVLRMDEEALNASVTYHDLRGVPHTQARWQMIFHCFNHSTQHRGQLITMMRALGMEDVPANDMIAYQRSLPR